MVRLESKPMCVKGDTQKNEEKKKEKGERKEERKRKKKKKRREIEWLAGSSRGASHCTEANGRSATGLALSARRTLE